jgi:hypothetical protein
MLPTMGPPETTMWEYPFTDNSWSLELDEFIRSIEMHKEPEGNIHDAKKALDIVENVYDKCNFKVII